MSLDWWGYKEKESQQYSKKITYAPFLFSFQIIKSIPVALAPLLEDLLSEA